MRVSMISSPEKMSNPDPVKGLSDEAREYLDLRLDDVKLRTVRGLSVAMSRIVTTIVILSVASALLLVLSFGLILLLCKLMNDYAVSALLVAAVLLITFAVLFLARKSLFKNTFVPMFVKMFFPEDSRNEKK